MGFLTSNFDLSETIFSDSDLRFAQSYLETWIGKEKSSWLKNPQGPFGKYWKENSVISACHLIDLARMMDRITHNITPESLPRFCKKVKDNLLPRPSDIKQFHETLTELQVAYALIASVSPLTIEPPIHDQARAPDFAFQLPEGMVYLDVTVFRGGPLEKWEDNKNHITQAIHNKVLKRKKALNIDIQIGLETINADQVIKQVLDEMNESDVGEVPVGNKGRIRWEPCPIVERKNDLSFADIPSFAGVFRSPGHEIRAVVASQANLTLPSLEDAEKINKLLFNAICNKLKEKHKQFPRNQPAYCVIKIGHPGVITESMLNTIRDHIWTRDDYRWISGIILFTPKQGFFLRDGLGGLRLSHNPNAKCPITESFGSLFFQSSYYLLLFFYSLQYLI